MSKATSPKGESDKKPGPFDAALSLLTAHWLAESAAYGDPIKAVSMKAAIRFLEAGASLMPDDRAWLESRVDRYIAEYVPIVDGATCPGKAMKDRFRALLAALPEVDALKAEVERLAHRDKVADTLIEQLKYRAEKAEAALAESAPPAEYVSACPSNLPLIPAPTKPLHGDVMCEICGAIGHLKPMPKKVSRETLTPFQNELWENCMEHDDAWDFVEQLAKELGHEVEEEKK